MKIKKEKKFLFWASVIVSLGSLVLIIMQLLNDRTNIDVTNLLILVIGLGGIESSIQRKQ